MLNFYRNNLRSFLISKTFVLNRNDIPKLDLMILKTEFLNSKKHLNVQIFWVLFVLTGQKPVVYSGNHLNSKCFLTVSLNHKQAYRFLHFMVSCLLVKFPFKKFLEKSESGTIKLTNFYMEFMETEMFSKYFTLENRQEFFQLSFKLDFFFKRPKLAFNLYLIQMLQLPIKLN